MYKFLVREQLVGQAESDVIHGAAKRYRDAAWR